MGWQDNKENLKFSFPDAEKYKKAYVKRFSSKGFPMIEFLYKDENGRWAGRCRTIMGVDLKRIGKKAFAEKVTETRRNLEREDKEREEEAAKKALMAAGKQPGQTVAEYLNLYINEAASSIEPSTVSGYRSLADNVIGSYIGNVELTSLTPNMVAAWKLEAQKDYSAASVRKGLVLLRAAMRQAVEREILSKDPTRTVKPPKQSAPKSNALDEKGRGAVIAFTNINPTSAVSIGIRIALYTGMREAELCALRWRNVNLENRTLRVAESFGRASKKDAELYAVNPLRFSGLYLKEPKNRGSIRTVCYPDDLANALRARRATMEAQCIDAGIPFDTDMFVLGSIKQYSTLRNGIPALDYTPMHPHTLWKRWHSIATDLELVGTEGKVPALHDLRHTYATAAIANGIDVKTVSSSMGHADAAMTLNRYASADPDAKRRAADTLGAVYEEEAKRVEKPAEILEFTKTGTEG